MQDVGQALSASGEPLWTAFSHSSRPSVASSARSTISAFVKVDLLTQNCAISKKEWKEVLMVVIR
jgi:hypothetical protein